MINFFKISQFDLYESNQNILIKLKRVIISYFFIFILISVVDFVFIFPLDFIITNFLHFQSIRGLIHETQKAFGIYPFYLIIFIGPFIEEILFRLILNINKLNVSIFVGILFLKLLTGQVYQFNIFSLTFVFNIILSIIVSSILYAYFPLEIIAFLNRKKRWLIIISIISFGILHILNIKVLHWQLALFYPFYVLPQMIMGYFITNLRLKYGFLWGLSLHILINASSFLLR